ncbi:uncharacterized protein B0I36DRAFT_368812 [Microdochium trichocladiopsis]|uniref:Uncharacterized protein n=1 Tax=Microdochium trichocladiopsis TaxID=1682393 RepID=A0A9P8XT13_9PEZI|nr:uncharacterized protein B0I36DRAFT_368812 [Microdochium trichocladiopsis]KAH7016232.1 hypothetical protein B0I36DRAFT_368812 [Microdochium trichocladiopsis]
MVASHLTTVAHTALAALSAGHEHNITMLAGTRLPVESPEDIIILPAPEAFVALPAPETFFASTDEEYLYGYAHAFDAMIMAYIESVLDELVKAADKMFEVAKENPQLSIGALLLIGAPHLAGGPAVAVLHALGFETTGVLAGSTAAALQSVIGSVTAGSIFSILTSAGAGGQGIAAITAALQGAGISLIFADVLRGLGFADY